MVSNPTLRGRVLLPGILASLLAFPAASQELTWDFNASRDGWESGYSDYSGESDFQFEAGPKPLPKPLDTTRQGYMLKGMNRSDDMFMFLRRKVEGLSPSTRYEAKFRIRLASQYASDLAGIGGAPGTSVFLKAGLMPQKPVDQNGRMNVDKGNQSQPGREMDTLGHIATPEGTRGYAPIERSNGGRAFVFTTAADGSAWLLIGTDSGFEGLTVLYYQGVDLVLTKAGTGIEGGTRRPGLLAPPGALSAKGVRADGRRAAYRSGSHW
jgi:hypothetical protein